MKIHKLEQGSQEWLDMRLEYPFTSSSAQAVASQGKGVLSHIHEKMLVKHGMETHREVWTEAIERGNLLEPEAIQQYEITTGQLIDEVGFITNEKHALAGDSPDGLVGEDGIIEAKCPNEKKYFAFREYRKIPSKYMWQCQWHLLITERKWCDFFMYHPEHGVEIERIYPIEEKQEKLLQGLNHAINLWNEAESLYK